MAGRFIIVKNRFFDEAKEFLKSLGGRDSMEDFLVPPRKDSRGWLAKKIDYLAVRVLFFLMLVFVLLTQVSLNWAVIGAAAGTLVVHILLARSEGIRATRYARDYRDYIVRSHTYEQLMKMDPGPEFKIFMAQVLNGLDGFSSVQPGDAVTNTAKFDLIGKFKGFPVVIMCNRYKKENEVGKSELVKFAGEMKNSGFTRGIYLSTSSFSEWAIDYVHSIKGELRVVLVDKAKLLEWIRLSGHALYPDDKKAAELEAAKESQERMVSLQKRERQNKRLMQAFFMVSIYLTVLSLVMRQWLQDWMLYLYFAVAVLNMLLGFLCYILFKHTRAVIRESSTLEQLD